MLTVLDQLRRRGPFIEVGFSFSGQKVASVLERLVIDIGGPVSMTVDHGTEFTSIALEEWAYRRGIKLDFTRPGKLNDNGRIEASTGDCVMSPGTGTD